MLCCNRAQAMRPKFPKVLCLIGSVLFLCNSVLAQWQGVQGGRALPLKVPDGGRAGLELLAPETTGIRFTNLLAQERHLTNQILLNGSGVAAGDVDGDGLTDVYFCALDRPNKLFRNLGGWKFEDITDKAGVALAELDATGAAFADLNGDGHLDLAVNSIGGGTHILLNDGKARFTRAQILNAGKGGMSLALADIDGDGDLDLYIANYRTVTIRDQPNTAFNVKPVDGKPTVVSINGRPLTDPDLADRFTFRFSEKTFAYDENGEADALYLNDGNGHFTLVSFTGGAFLDEQGKPLTKPPLDWGLSVMFRDLNQDGAPDIYVCNDFKSPDRIWINNGKGQFRAAPPLAFRQISLSSMGVDAADINRDGRDDIFVVDMLSRDHARRHQQRTDVRMDTQALGMIEGRPQTSRNTLFLNRGDGTYAEIAQLSGVEASEWSWTPIFMDVDLDGYEDLLITTGFERDNMNVDVLRRLEAAKREQNLSTLEQLQLRKMFPRLVTPKLAFRNLGNLQFADASREWGFDAPGISQGMALADLDNDGDLDVIINNMNGAASVYRNQNWRPRVAVRLKGQGVGARVTVSGGPVTQSQEIIAGGRYLSGDDPIRMFACGDARALQIEVLWRNGTRSFVSNAQPNYLYEIDPAFAQPYTRPSAPAVSPQFEDVSSLLAHTHHEDSVDDFTMQPLLPHRLSHSGPGVAWVDVNGDGLEDLCIGGDRIACFVNNGRGSFSLWKGPPSDQAEKPTGLVAAKPGTLLTGAGELDFGDRKVSPLGLSDVPVLGPFTAVYVNSSLQVFAGGRTYAQKYPEPVSSIILPNKKLIPNVGTVSGAVFTDIDGDGDADLAVACEPGSLRIFENDKGELTDVTQKWGLDAYRGFWNGITAGDFNGDGKMDLAASNLGLNTKYKSLVGKELTILYGDFDGNGTVEWLEAYREAGRMLPVQPFHVVGAAMPWLRERLGTFAAYAHASMEEIHGEYLQKAKSIQINWLQSAVFLNRGGHFEPMPLPMEAQFAPAFAVCVADLDGDSNEDIFLSQNLFAVPADVSRYDAGRGLCLRGKGDGTFAAVSGNESGIKIYGEQRGAAVCDYDGDGRTDLVVAQNAAETKLLRNAKGKPGLRIRLVGPAENPNAIGAFIRLKSEQRLGPAREIHAGSGYWSQDGVVQVLHGDWATHVVVRWPGSQVTTHEIPAGAKELRVTQK
jgi:hypothetical protein